MLSGGQSQNVKKVFRKRVGVICSSSTLCIRSAEYSMSGTARLQTVSDRSEGQVQRASTVNAVDSGSIPVRDKPDFRTFRVDSFHDHDVRR